jgi:hypothetical protein
MTGSHFGDLHSQFHAQRTTAPVHDLIQASYPGSPARTILAGSEIRYRSVESSALADGLFESGYPFASAFELGRPFAPRALERLRIVQARSEAIHLPDGRPPELRLPGQAGHFGPMRSSVSQAELRDAIECNGAGGGPLDVECWEESGSIHKLVLNCIAN